MTVTLNQLGIWATLAGVIIAGYGEYRSEANATLKRQQAMDALYTRLGNDEAAIAAVASQLPQQQRDILTAIRTAQQAAQAQPQVMFEKSMPHQLKLDSVPAAADAPAEEKP